MNVIAIEDECLDVDILVSSLNLVNEITRIVNIFEVGRRFKVKCLPDLIPGSIQLDHVLQVREVFQVDQLIV